MRSPSRVTLLALAMLLLGGLLLPGLAAAHARAAGLSVELPDTVAPAPAAAARPITIAPATPPVWPVWPLAAALAMAGAGLALVAPRRALRMTLVVLLAVFAIETGVHSVHHLADRQAATQCVVSLASAHVQGASINAPVAVAWIPMVLGAVVVVEPDRPGARSLRPDEGRAPPA